MKKSGGKKALDIVLFFILGIAVGIAVGMTFALVLKKGNKEPEKNYQYEVVTTQDCDGISKIYFEEENRTVYLYCLNSLKIRDGEDSFEFKNYYHSHPQALIDMISSLSIDESYDDGGSILYRDHGVLSKNGFSILKCNTLLGNQDLYIGPKSMKFEKNFCKSESPEVVDNFFIRTYNVLNVEPSEDKNAMYITIKQFQGTEVSTVRISKKIAPNMKAGKNYEFKFQSGNTAITDSIVSIFEKRKLLSVIETDKVGLQQIQEKVQ